METTTQPTNAIARIVTQSGLDKEKQEYILQKFSDYTAIAAEWEAKAKAIVVTDVSQVEEMKQAREGRILLMRKRGDIEKTRKILKDSSIKEGRAIDDVAKALTALIEPTEKYLDEQEGFAERKKQERLRIVRTARLKEAEPYMDYLPVMNMDWAGMSDADFQKLLSGAKLQHQAQLDYQKKIEEDQIAKEEQDIKDREAQKAENERLKAEAAEKESIRNKRNQELRPYIVFIRDYNKMLNLPEEEYVKELADIKIGADLEWEHQRKEQQREAQEKADAEAKLKLEREQRQKLEREIKQKREDEEKGKREAEESKEKAELAPDKVKIQQLITDLSAINIPQVKSAKAKKIIATAYEDTEQLINKIGIEMNKLK